MLASTVRADKRDTDILWLVEKLLPIPTQNFISLLQNTEIYFYYLDSIIRFALHSVYFKSLL